MGPLGSRLSNAARELTTEFRPDAIITLPERGLVCRVWVLGFRGLV